jgi:ABC-type transport system involved in multi-copper enzyme maturation permease subunit
MRAVRLPPRRLVARSAKWWLGVAALGAGGAALLTLGSDWDRWHQLAGWLALGLLALAVTSRFWRELLGPVCFWEMVRQSRREWMYWLRVAYLVNLLLAIGCVYLLRFGSRGHLWEALAAPQEISPERLAAFTERVFAVILGVQLGGVLILTPAFTAGAIAEERERRTLDFLLVTHLSDLTLVVGKLAARLGGLLLVLLAGLPVLACLQLLGGIDPDLLLGGYAVTLLTMLGLGSLGILISSDAPSVREAIFNTYAVAGLYLVGSLVMSVPVLGAGPASGVAACFQWLTAGNPGVAVYRVSSDLSAGLTPAQALPPVLRDCALFHLLLTAVSLAGAARMIRRKEVPASAPPREPDLPPRKLIPPELDVRAIYRERPPVTDRPMLWKEGFAGGERHFDPLLALFRLPRAIGLWVALTVVVCVGASLLSLEIRDPLSDFAGGLARGMRWWLTGILIPLVCFACLAVAIRTAGAFTSEREGQTLDSLLTTPLTNREIVNGKWLGGVLSCSATWCVVGAGLLLGAITLGLAPLGWLLVPAAIAAQVALAASLGLACSFFSASTWRATAATLLILGLLTLGHWGIYKSVTMIFDMPWTERHRLFQYHAAALTPPVTLYHAIRGKEASLVAIGLAQQAGLAAVLWWLVRFRFARVTGRMPVGRLRASPPPQGDGR